MLFNRNFWFALFVFIGTTVGAGIFGLPYIAAKSGIAPVIFYFFILGGAMVLIHLFFGEVLLRTKEDYRLVGLTRKYLGRKSSVLVSFSVIIGLGGSLLVYIILGGDFLSILLSNIFPLSPFYGTLIFWLIFSPLILKGIKLIAPVEILTNSLFFIIIIAIFIFGAPKISFDNFEMINFSNSLLPYGVILFSLAGMSALPEIKTLLKTGEEKKSLKKVITSSFLIIIPFCLLFSFLVFGISGKSTSEDVFGGLAAFLGPQIIFLGALASFITISDSFLIIALYLRNTCVCDYKLSPTISNFLVIGVPMILFLAGFRQFVEVIGFLGSIIGAVEGVIIILLYMKSKTLGNRKPEYSINVPKIVPYFLMALFIFGAIFQLF
ncbi:MAG: aromatic amino acid transport family protein [Candidatus Pacebacteria bacterium]|nr:aromatic amino acid transport family protein [Candidatus Paceibacterota bacterium]